MKLLSKYNPVEVADIDMTWQIGGEPEFCWWVLYTLWKRYCIIYAVNYHFIKATHKHGTEVPTSVDHAKNIDEINGNTLWMDEINKDMAVFLV